nr:BTAD domain-containing putative transcriptional regulator [Streptomyces hilarionis]
MPELTALCDAHPLNEPLQALRLRALRDAGRGASSSACRVRRSGPGSAPRRSASSRRTSS